MLPVTVLYCLAVVVSTRPTSSQPTVDQQNDLATSSEYYMISEISVVMQSQIRDLQNLILTKLNEINAKQTGMQSQITNLQNSVQAKCNEIDARQTVNCPTDFIQVPSVNGCYKVIMKETTWQNASAQCRSLHKDSDLVVINSDSEHNAIVNLMLQQFSGKSVWTAGQRIDPSTNSTFVWKVRRASSSTNIRSSEADICMLPMTYRNWNTGEPTFTSETESCLDLRSNYNYFWNDNTCSVPNYPLCEIDL
jgi:hypothetical protein